MMKCNVDNIGNFSGRQIIMDQGQWGKPYIWSVKYLVIEMSLHNRHIIG